MDELLKTYAKKKEEFNLELFNQIEAYYKGDHFQEGKGWSGPDVKKLADQLKRGFVGDPVLSRAAQRAILAVVGKEPMWEFVPSRKLKLVDAKDETTGEQIRELEKPTTEEQELIDLANELTTNYWDRNRLARWLIQVTTNLVLHNASYARIYALEEGEMVIKDIESALEILNVHMPALTDARELADEHGRILGVAFTHKSPNGQLLHDVSWYDRKRKVVVTERVDDTYTPLPGVKPMELQIGDRLPIYKLKDAGLIKPVVLSLQKALDHDNTMLTMNNTVAGFRERLMINAMEPTEEYVDPSTGETKERIVPFKSGAGSTAWIKGIELTDPNTGDVTGYSTPQVMYKDPVDQSGLLKSIDHKIRRILEAMSQAHVLISGDANASGTSRQQAVQDHVASLELIKREVESMLRWMFETLLAMAGGMTGKQDLFKPIRCVVSCRVSAVQLTSAERSQYVNEYNAKLRTRAKTMAILGEDDPDAEIAALDQEDLAGVKEEVRKQRLLPGEDKKQ